MMNKNKISTLGYTLIEIMVALAVFAILAAMTSSIMVHTFNTRARVNAKADQLSALQFTYSLLERDTAQMIERATLDKDLQAHPPFIGLPSYVEFTRLGAANPNGLDTRSTLKRVAYLCSKHRLIRRTWSTLDTPDRKDYQDRVLLNQVTHCSFAYLAHNRQSLTEWRPYAVQQNQKKETLPQALQINISMTHWGNMNLLFAVPGALYAH